MLLMGWTSSTCVTTYVEKLLEQRVAFEDMARFARLRLAELTSINFLPDGPLDARRGVLHARWEGGLPLDRADSGEGHRPQTSDLSSLFLFLVTSGT